MSYLVAAAIAVAMIVHGSHAAAQSAPAETTGLGPVLCYDLVTDRAQLGHVNALQLCTGAVSDAPARCFLEATADLDIDELEGIRLCQMATSIHPASCARGLGDTTDLYDGAIVDHCAALRWPTIAAAGGGSPECVRAALDRTFLSERRALELCRGSQTTAPVACFALGKERLLTIPEADLVELCAAIVIYHGWRFW